MLGDYITAATLVFCAFTVSCTEGKCGPMQWEALIAGTDIQLVQGKLHKYEFMGTYAADYKQKKDALLESVFDNGKLVANYTLIQSEDVSVFADNMQRKCTRLPSAKVQQLCTDSAELQYLTSWTLGTEMTDTYAYNGNGRVGSITFFRDSFTMAAQSYSQVLSGTPQEIGMQFGNLTTTIKDPHVFDLPSFC